MEPAPLGASPRSCYADHYTCLYVTLGSKTSAVFAWLFLQTSCPRAFAEQPEVLGDKLESCYLQVSQHFTVDNMLQSCQAVTQITGVSTMGKTLAMNT